MPKVIETTVFCIINDIFPTDLVKIPKMLENTTVDTNQRDHPGCHFGHISMKVVFTGNGSATHPHS